MANQTLTSVLKKLLSKPKSAASAGSVGPALTELDTITQQADRVQVIFQVGKSKDTDGTPVGIDTAGLKYGFGLRVPLTFLRGRPPGQGCNTFSGTMLQLAGLLPGQKVRFDTVEVHSTKSPKQGKELRDLVLSGISEAFAQPIPDAEQLAAATKAYRAQKGQVQAAARAEREKAREAFEREKAKAKAKIEKTIAKNVGKVTDIATFLKALELRADAQKIDKATKMLKASGFQLFNDVTETHLNGVVKSQTDPDLVYACRLESSGTYSCCTQNLNICGGLRGSVCKHLLVLIIGLVQAGELDPATIDGWIAQSHDRKPELNKEVMGEIFIRYKGAEAGEVDWRPTETVPEDYYAL